MQLHQKVVFNEENTSFSLSHALAGYPSRSKNLVCVFFGLAFLGLSLLSLVACSADPTCASNAINAACPVPLATVQGNTLPTTKKHKSAPTAGGPGKQNRKALPRTVAALSPTPTPTPFRSDKDLVICDVQHYAELVLDGSASANHKAYNLLAVTLRNRVSFGNFLTNPNYILYKGCWVVHQDQITLTQVNSSTWIVVLPMTKINCVNESVLQQYLWNFRIQINYNLPEIVAVTLVPKKS